MSERETFPSLTGLRFILAAWITVYHLIHSYGPAALADSPFVALGNARVDIFFTLSGFVLAHVYAVRPSAEARFDYRTFLVARVARLYPLHLLGLAVLVAAVGAAYVLGKGAEMASFTAPGLLATTLMLQATIFPDAAAWNFPTWTLSAEAFGYLVFPAFIAAGAALRGRGMVFWGLAISCVAFVGLVWPFLGQGALSEATQILGIVRGAMCMFVGVAARYAFDGVPLKAPQSVAVTAAGALVTGAAAILGLDLWVVAMGASCMIFGFASVDRNEMANPLTHPVMQSLGRWSYALFVLHMPIFMILARVLQVKDGELTLLQGAIMFAVALAVSWPTHRFIEEPARMAIRDWYDRRKRAAAPASASVKNP